MDETMSPRKLGRWQNRLERDVCATLSQRDGLALIAHIRALSAALAQAEQQVRDHVILREMDLRTLGSRLAQAEAERDALREVLAEARGWIARVSPTVLSPLARILDRAQETDEQWAARMVRYVNDRCAAALPAPPSPPAGEEVPS